MTRGRKDLTGRRECVAVGVGRLPSQNPHEDEDDGDEDDEGDPKDDVEGHVVDTGSGRDGRGRRGGRGKVPIAFESGIVRHLAVHHKLVRICNVENEYKIKLHNLYPNNFITTCWAYLSGLLVS